MNPYHVSPPASNIDGGTTNQFCSLTYLQVNFLKRTGLLRSPSRLSLNRLET